MKQSQNIQELGYIPPSAVDIEKAIIGAILLEKDAFEDIDGFLREEDFYYPRHAILFRCAKSLFDQRKAIDYLTIMEELKSCGELESIGGVVFLSELTENISSTAHTKHHAKIVKQKSIERQIIEISYQAISKVHDGDPIEDVLFWQGKEIEKRQELIIGNNVGSQISVPIKKSIGEMYNRIELNKQGKFAGIPTGLSGLDKITGGWQNSELIVVAGRPGSGKTAFALKFAKAAAMANHPVAMFSLEMSDVSLANRLLLSESNVDAYKFRMGKLSPEETSEIEKAAGHLWNLPIYVDDNASASMSYIRSKSRRLQNIS